MQAHRSPEEVDYVELHANGYISTRLYSLNIQTLHFAGTAQGDPTEANWVGAAFQREGDLTVGSVKGNIGSVDILCAGSTGTDINSQALGNYGFSSFVVQSLRNVPDQPHPSQC